MTGRCHFKLLILVTLGVLLLGAIGLSACAQQAPATPPTPETPATPALVPVEGGGKVLTVVKVDISDFAFSPTPVIVPLGTTVTWTNGDSAPHTVSSRTGLFESGTLSKDAAFSYTFTQGGVFQYYCKLHPYMAGEVVVGE